MSNTSYSIFALEQCNEDMLTEKINMEELFEKKREKDLRKLQTFNKILARIHRHIKLISAQRQNNNCCWYVIPEIILGVPDYNQPECVNYIMEKLETNGFVLRYIVPNLLFICWQNYVPKYVRHEIEKKIGIKINSQGNIINQSNNEYDDDYEDDFANKSNQRLIRSNSSIHRHNLNLISNNSASSLAGSRNFETKQKKEKHKSSFSLENQNALKVSFDKNGDDIRFMENTLDSIKEKEKSKKSKYNQEPDPNAIQMPKQFQLKYNPFDLHEPAQYHERFPSINTSLLNAQEMQTKQNEFEFQQNHQHQNISSNDIFSSSSSLSSQPQSNSSITPQENRGDLENIKKKASNASRNFTPIQNYKSIGIGNLFEF